MRHNNYVYFKSKERKHYCTQATTQLLKAEKPHLFLNGITCNLKSIEQEYIHSTVVSST